MKMTIRLGHRNTSVRIRDDLLALWYILCFPDEEMTYSKVHREVRKFISRCLTRYETPHKKKAESRYIESQNKSGGDRGEQSKGNQSESFRVKECYERQDKKSLVEGSVLESKTRLTDYINSCIVQEVLDRPERVKYKKCLKLLSETMFNSASIDIQDIAEYSGEYSREYSEKESRNQS